MLKQARLEQIRKLLESSGEVEIQQLCRLFNVAEMTARRDLDELAKDEMIIRTHGGAVLSTKNILVETPFGTRLNENQEAKDAIARIAMEYIEDGNKIFFNSSSTVFSLAKIIDNSRKLLVVTEAINIAAELNARTNLSVFQIGGELRKNTLSCVGHFTEEMIKRFTFDLAIVGINSVNEEGRIFCGTTYEFGIYEAVFAAARKIIVVADSSKIGHDDFCCVGSLKDVDVLITDSGADRKLLENFREMGIADIRIADVG
jgi:DeoR/GlpR family transcriptional regulator of sugar metabolism